MSRLIGRTASSSLSQFAALLFSICCLFGGLTGCLPVGDSDTPPPQKDDIEIAVSNGFRLGRLGQMDAAEESFDTAVRQADGLPKGLWRDRLVSRAYMARGDFWVETDRLLRATIDYERARGSAPEEQVNDVIARLALIARVRGQESEESRYLTQLSPGGGHRLSQLERTIFAELLSGKKPTDLPIQHKESLGDLDILPRSQWNPSSMRDNRTAMKPIFRATVHHSGTDAVSQTDRTDIAQMIRSIQRTHQESQQWADIGYHFIIDPAGRVWQARSLEWQGSHAGGDNNRGNIGVCVLGNFDIQSLNPAQGRSLSVFLEMVMERYGFGPGSIFPHREFKVTACPGNALIRFVKEFRSTKAGMISRSSHPMEEFRADDGSLQGSWDLAVMLRAEGVEFLPSCEDAASFNLRELDLEDGLFRIPSWSRTEVADPGDQMPKPMATIPTIKR